MRKCIRCDFEMVENLEVIDFGSGYGLYVKEKGMLKGKKLGDVKCAVCPECGYMETYIENTDKIKKYSTSSTED